MRIEIRQPNPEYPFAYLVVDSAVNTPTVDVMGILLDKGITLLGPWERTESFLKAPVLLEYEHVKPRKKRK